MKGESMRMRKRQAGALVAGLALVFGALAPTAAMAETDEPATLELNGIVTDAPVTTPEELDAYILSDHEKSMTMDSETGEILEVRAGADDIITPLITWQNTCLAGNLCLLPANAPNLAYGFAGNGAVNGSWSRLGSWSTGQWTGRVTTAAGGTSSYVGPNTRVVFNQVPTTVSRVQIR
jgi:hypothetical protein